jgi:hypothetical protein
VEIEDVGRLVDAAVRVLKDPIVAVKAACALEAWVRKYKEKADASGGGGECLTELIQRSADVFAGKAAQPVESEGCPGSLRVQFTSKDDVWTDFEAQVYLVGPTGPVGVKRVHRHEREAHFTNLAPGPNYYVYVSAGQDFCIEKYKTPTHGQGSGETRKDEGWLPLGKDNQIQVEVKQARETLLQIWIAYKPRELDVFAFREEGGGPARDQKLEGVPIRLFYEGQEVSCCTTGKDGHVRTSLNRPGPYRVEAPDRIRINERLFTLAHPGQIAVLPQSGPFTPTVIAIGYTLAGGVIRISPNLEGLAAVDVPAALTGQVQFALFRDRDPSFVQTATADGKSEICWDGLPEGVYTVVVKAGSSIQLVEPSHGAFRVSLVPGQDANLSRFVRLRWRPDTTLINEISGTVTDERGRPMVNCPLELLLAATQTVLFTSFSDANGQYFFYTDIDPARLAIRARGQSTQLLGQAQGATAGPGLTPAATSPTDFFAEYPLLTTPAAVSSY